MLMVVHYWNRRSDWLRVRSNQRIDKKVLPPITVGPLCQENLPNRKIACNGQWWPGHQFEVYN